MRKIISFLKEARAELGKVVWPTRRRAVRLTVIVVIASLIFAAFIGAVDYGLSKGVEAVIDAAEDKPATDQPLDVESIPGQGTDGAPVQIPAGPDQPQPQST